MEELQFRLEEEAIDKTTLEAQKVDYDERIFELEEALATAKETNERISADLATVGGKPDGLSVGPAGDGPSAMMPPPPPPPITPSALDVSLLCCACVDLGVCMVLAS